LVLLDVKITWIFLINRKKNYYTNIDAAIE
jgi:hypothetical protein